MFRINAKIAALHVGCAGGNVIGLIKGKVVQPSGNSRPKDCSANNQKDQKNKGTMIDLQWLSVLGLRCLAGFTHRLSDWYPKTRESRKLVQILPLNVWRPKG